MDEALYDEIIEDLSEEIAIDNKMDYSKLSMKVKNAIREVRRARNYPKHFTEEEIQSDLKEYYSNIRELALYDYNQIGAEGQVSHNENGTSRSWKSRMECMNGVFAYCR